MQTFFIMNLCSAIYDAFYHKTFLDRSELTVRKSGSIKHIPFKRFIPSFLQAKRNVNTFLRVVRGIIRQYNLHSWGFVIKAQLNSSRSLRLWNLWPIIGPHCIPCFALCHLSIPPWENLSKLFSYFS